MLLGRVAFTIFGLDIYWYGIIMAGSILLAFLLVLFYCKKKGLGTDFAFEMLLATVVPGIICARLFSVLFEDGTTILDYFNFRDGGMSIIGAVIGGAAGIGVLCLIKKKNFFDIADIVVPVLILAQGIGRWGNYANQEVFGAVVTNPALQHFPLAVFIEADGMWHQALFFYESILDIVGFIILTVLLLKVKKRGLTTGVYFLYYGIVRTCLEGLREQDFILKFKGMPISLTLSIVMIIVGSAIVVGFIVEQVKVYKLKKAQKLDEPKPQENEVEK